MVKLNILVQRKWWNDNIQCTFLMTEGKFLHSVSSQIWWNSRNMKYEMWNETYCAQIWISIYTLTKDNNSSNFLRLVLWLQCRIWFIPNVNHLYISFRKVNFTWEWWNTPFSSSSSPLAGSPTGWWYFTLQSTPRHGID